jgi:hypothetical protein
MKNRTLRLAATIASALCLAASLPACAPTESNVSNAQSERTLERLQAARKIDLSNAKDPEVGPAASGDYSLRADKAAQVMDDLEHGQYVSQSQIDAAMFVPPKSLSPAQKAELINELNYARNLDDRGWWDWTRDPVIAQDFSVQKKKANRAIRDLETDQQISWSEIDEGLAVPRYNP